MTGAVPSVDPSDDENVTVPVGRTAAERAIERVVAAAGDALATVAVSVTSVPVRASSSASSLRVTVVGAATTVMASASALVSNDPFAT